MASQPVIWHMVGQRQCGGGRWQSAQGSDADESTSFCESVCLLLYICLPSLPANLLTPVFVQCPCRCGDSAWTDELLQCSLQHVRETLKEAATEEISGSQRSFIPLEVLAKMTPLKKSFEDDKYDGSGTAAEGDGRGSWLAGGGWGCCIDCMKPASGRPWEASTGALYLLRELAGGSFLSGPQDGSGEIEGYIQEAWGLLRLNGFKVCCIAIEQQYSTYYYHCCCCVADRIARSCMRQY